MATAHERRIPVGRFRACCLELLDEISETGLSIVITKNGRPIVRVVPHAERAPDLRGSVVAQRDLVSPAGEYWHSEAP